MIFIVGTIDDPHIKSVVGHLSHLGANYIVLDRFNFEAASGSIILKFGTDNVLHLGAGISSQNISAIWWRQKPPFVVPSEKVSDYYDSVFTSQEWTHVLRFLELKFQDVFAINNPNKAAIASNKLYQLELACSLGFKVPKTLIANNHTAVETFISETKNSDIIFKTLNAYMNPTGILTYTTLITSDLVSEKKASISVAPGIYQELIKRNTEIRVTVVGKDVFAVKINQTADNNLDWRKDIFSDIYEVFILPAIVKRKILKLHKAFDLFYGAYDFIIDEKNEYVFLEVNPAGQWLWLERKLKLPISDKIANALHLADKRCQKANAQQKYLQKQGRTL